MLESECITCHQMPDICHSQSLIIPFFIFYHAVSQVQLKLAISFLSRETGRHEMNSDQGRRPSGPELSEPRPESASLDIKLYVSSLCPQVCACCPHRRQGTPSLAC